MTNVIAPEMAESEFNRFAEEMGLDLDTATMDDEDIAGLEQHKNKILRSIEKGQIFVEDNGELTFTPSKPADAEPIRFKEPTGATMLAMDKAGRNADMAKLHGVMANMTGQSQKVFAKMKMRDYKICSAIITIFLG